MYDSSHLANYAFFLFTTAPLTELSETSWQIGCVILMTCIFFSPCEQSALNYMICALWVEFVCGGKYQKFGDLEDFLCVHTIIPIFVNIKKKLQQSESVKSFILNIVERKVTFLP